ncbi:amylovoran biosynthesis protein AmsF [Izhakiella capsodis]|uniref:Amylovoran biosynthesis protein AmsF n=1 Tax=Izhakiella capsodis TaxID=1367852 RepID=A0A1I4Y578_9GAMM|nr:hypothetical protein [Izhakiella capsodis]SFN32650.1 amylovoran biosynthesis protein AmsF [Izhakiella capsodis]
MARSDPPAEARPLVPHFTLHNGKAGIGANAQGDLLLASRALKDEEVDRAKPAGFVAMVINGEIRAVPYFSIKSQG